MSNLKYLLFGFCIVFGYIILRFYERLPKVLTFEYSFLSLLIAVFFICFYLLLLLLPLYLKFKSNNQFNLNSIKSENIKKIINKFL